MPRPIIENQDLGAVSQKFHAFLKGRNPEFTPKSASEESSRLHQDGLPVLRTRIEKADGDLFRGNVHVVSLKHAGAQYSVAELHQITADFLRAQGLTGKVHYAIGWGTSSGGGGTAWLKTFISGPTKQIIDERASSGEKLNMRKEEPGHAIVVFFNKNR